MPPGQHGTHVHITGRCDAPTFKSAGDHWNPVDKQHGLDNPKGQHGGDMPNLNVGEDGRGSVSYMLKGATLEGIRDADGSAMVVRSEEHTSELQSLMRISYAVFCLKKQTHTRPRKP